MVFEGVWEHTLISQCDPLKHLAVGTTTQGQGLGPEVMRTQSLSRQAEPSSMTQELMEHFYLWVVLLILTTFFFYIARCEFGHF